MIRGGGRVVTGTDSPIDHTAVSTHMNLRAMVKYGLTPYEALTTATRVPGEFLEEPLGRIEPGMYADLTFLGGDPLQDITKAADVRLVMVNGELHTVDDLLAPFAAGGPHGGSPARARAAQAPRPPREREVLVARPALSGGEQALLLRGRLTT